MLQNDILWFFWATGRSSAMQSCWHHAAIQHNVFKRKKKWSVADVCECLQRDWEQRGYVMTERLTSRDAEVRQIFCACCKSRNFLSTCSDCNTLVLTERSRGEVIDWTVGLFAKGGVQLSTHPNLWRWLRGDKQKEDVSSKIRLSARKLHILKDCFHIHLLILLCVCVYTYHRLYYSCCSWRESLWAGCSLDKAQ